MSDDIVTRLRGLREVLMGNPIMAREVQGAMDEIERLRAEVVRRGFYPPYSDSYRQRGGAQVSDDIVTRLRTTLAHADDVYDTMNQAADEIERLRQEVSRLMQVICDASPDDDYLLVRQECDAIWNKIHKDWWPQ